MKKLKGIIVFTGIVFLFALAYFVSVYSIYSGREEKETAFTEIGEGSSAVGLGALIIIDGRTALKLSLGKGAFAKRVLPEFGGDANRSLLKGLRMQLNKPHLHVGVLAIALILSHAVFMGLSD